MPEWTSAFIAERQDEHGTQFADRKKGNEGERIHPSQISLAVGDIHGPPQHSSAESCDDADCSPSRGGLAGGSKGQQSSSAEHHDCSTHYAQPPTPSRLAKFIEQQKTPEDAE